MALLLKISLLWRLGREGERVASPTLTYPPVNLTSEPKVRLEARQLTIPFNYQTGGTLLHLFALRM